MSNKKRTKAQIVEDLKHELAEQQKKRDEYSAKLKEKIKLAKGRENELLRKAETRRKVLLGAMLKDRIEKDKTSKSQVVDWLDNYLIRDDDRALFELAPIDKTVTAEKGNDITHVSDEAGTSNENDNPDCNNSDIAIDDSYLELPNNFEQLPNDSDNYN